MSDRPEDEPQQPEPRPEEPGEEGESDALADYESPGDDLAYTLADFHNVIQKQVLNATYETLIESKLAWELVEPFLNAAREVCRGDFLRTGRVQVHGVVAEGEGWSDAEEAYLSLSIADQENGSEWLSRTWWLSDLVLAEADPKQVREAAGAIERSLEKIKGWLAENEAKGPDADG